MIQALTFYKKQRYIHGSLWLTYAHVRSMPKLTQTQLLIHTTIQQKNNTKRSHTLPKANAQIKLWHKHQLSTKTAFTFTAHPWLTYAHVRAMPKLTQAQLLIHTTIQHKYNTKRSHTLPKANAQIKLWHKH